MRRTLAILALSFVSSITFAQEPQQACETVTTTTTRCTGTAAPLALPPQADDQEPPQRIRLQPPPSCEGCGARFEPSRNGYQLTLDGNGGFAYVHRDRTPNAGVWVPGLVVWLGSYAGTAVGAYMNDGNGWAAIPFFGALGSGIYYGLDNDTGRALGYTVGGLAQIGGLVTFIVGMSAGHGKLDRIPVKVTPITLPGGGGMGLSGSF